MRGRSLARFVAAGQVALLAAALVGPGSVAAATLGFNLLPPSISTVAYSDFVTLRWNYTCINGGDTPDSCPTTIQTDTATFALRPTGGGTFTTIVVVNTSFTFTMNAAGCTSTCTTQTFQTSWKAGRFGTTVIAPGVYDLRLTTTISAGELVILNGLTITPERTTTAYTGGAAGVGGDALALGANVFDTDRGLSVGTGIFSPDAQLGGVGMVTFALYDETNTTLEVGPVSATLTSSGLTSGSPSLVMPTAGGSFRLRTSYLGNAFYNPSDDLDVITVAPANTPPVLSVPTSTLIVEATSDEGASVDFTVSVTDAEDDPDPTPTCGGWSSGDTFPLGETTVSCSATDTGGLSDSDTFVVSVVDTTSPTVVVGTAESDNGAGWHNGASNDGAAGVTVDAGVTDLVGVATLSCTDNGVDVGALASSGGSFDLGDGTHAVVCTATDGAGNQTMQGASFNVDQTDPTIESATAPPAAASGWWNAATGAPTITFTCADAGSGVAACSDAVTLGEGADQSVTGIAADVAGNTVGATVSDLGVDLTPPSVPVFVGGPADGSAHSFGFVPESPGCSATDGLSGLASCSVTGYSTLVGSHTLVATATDVAGNATTATLAYEVLPWSLVGFGKPIDMTGVNLVKAGNAVSLRFEVFAGDVELTSADVVAGLEQQQFSCTTDALLGAAAPAAHGRSGRSTVDTSGGHLSTRWESPDQPGTCWLVTLRTADGSSLSAVFRLR